MSSPATLEYARPAPPAFDAASVTRPDPLLWRYYLLVNILGGPLYPLLLMPAYIRYRTLRYRFDADGVAMSWGWVFRKEVYFTYRRIQDIHVTRNMIHRWLGLSEVAVQTAAGSAAAEMNIEGLRDPEGLRDFLYSKMRGARGEADDGSPLHAEPLAASHPHAGEAASGTTDGDELLRLLTEIRDALRDEVVMSDLRADEELDPSRMLPHDPAVRWAYRGIWAWLVRWFRVPEEPPTLPVRPGEFHRSFRPAPGYLRKLKFEFWVCWISLDAFLIGLWAALIVFAPRWGIALTAPIAFLAVVPPLITYLALHLRYDTMWYVLTDRSLRVRRGIWILHEVTITFENVQTVKVTQGPLQRYFGIGNVEVRTAGGGMVNDGQGGQYEGTGHSGVLEGVANATEIRDLILSRLKQSKTTGLGDESHVRRARDARPATGTATITGRHLALLREVRDMLRDGNERSKTR